MKIRQLLNPLVFVCILVLAGAANKASAQIGVKISMMGPRGDLGPVFKSAPMYEIFVTSTLYRGKVASRMGFIHTELAPRLDTFPVYMAQTEGSNGITTVFPGYEVYYNMKINLFYMDASYRLFRYKGFTGYLGMGLIIGHTHMEYDRGYLGQLSENGGVTENMVGGLRGTARLHYTIIPHFDILVEANYHAVTATDWSTIYSHKAFGIGVNYTYDLFDSKK